MAYSLDVRRLVMSYLDSGGSKSSASRIYNVHRSTIYKWISLRRTRDSVARPPLERGCRKIDPVILAQRVEANPEAHLKEHAAYFGVRIQTISEALKRLGITRKKRPICTKNGTPRSAVYIWSK